MPASVRFLALLFAAALFAAVASGVGIYRETLQRGRAFAEPLAGGSIVAGRQEIQRYGCGACHVIGGVPGASGKVGPALNGVAVRAHLAGQLPNDPATMIRWLEHPQALVPGTGMPEMGVTDRDAHDMAAYLYTLNK